MKRYIEDPRISAWIVLFLGTGATIAANILHAEPIFWARALSGSIPLILLFAGHTAAYAQSWVVRASMIPVAVFAFFISYDHMNSLAMKYGEQYEVAKVYPLAVDGALLVATLVLATYRPENKLPQIAKPAKATPREALSDLDFMREIWPDRSFLLISEDQRETVVRREVGKARGKSLGASRANTLIREFLADLDKEATAS